MNRNRKRLQERRAKSNNRFMIRGRLDSEGRLLEVVWTGSIEEPDIRALVQ